MHLLCYAIPCGGTHAISLSCTTPGQQSALSERRLHPARAPAAQSTFQPQLPLLLHPLMMGSPTTKEQLEKSAAELKRLLGVLDA